MNNRVYVLTLEQHGEGDYYSIVEAFNRREDAIARMVEECNSNEDFIEAMDNEDDVTIDKERGYASSDPDGYHDYYSYYNVEAVVVKGKNFEFDKDGNREIYLVVDEHEYDNCYILRGAFKHAKDAKERWEELYTHDSDFTDEDYELYDYVEIDEDAMYADSDPNFDNWEHRQIYRVQKCTIK